MAGSVSARRRVAATSGDCRRCDRARTTLVRLPSGAETFFAATASGEMTARRNRHTVGPRRSRGARHVEHDRAVHQSPSVRRGADAVRRRLQPCAARGHDRVFRLDERHARAAIPGADDRARDRRGDGAAAQSRGLRRRCAVRSCDRSGQLRRGHRPPVLPDGGRGDVCLRWRRARRGRGARRHEGRHGHHRHGCPRSRLRGLRPGRGHARLVRAGHAGKRLVPGRGDGRVRERRSHHDGRLLGGRRRWRAAGHRHARRPAGRRHLPPGVLRGRGRGHRRRSPP